MENQNENPYKNYINNNSNQNRGKNQHPSQYSYGKRMWYLWGPLVIKWAIGVAVTIAAEMAYLLVYAYYHMKEFMEMYNNQEELTAFMEQMTKDLLQHTTLIEGAAALITIPVLLIWFHLDRRKDKQWGVVPNRKASLWKYGGVVLIAGAMSLGVNNLMILSNLQELSEEYQEVSTAFYAADFGMEILCLGILIPMAEELVFRGMMFKRLRALAGFMQAALYSSVVFAIFHGNLIQMLYGFAAGMLFSWLYEKYGSVKAPILAHIAMNLTSVIATEYQLFEWMMENVVRVCGITALCAAAASTMYVLIQRIDEKPEQTISNN